MTGFIRLIAAAFLFFGVAVSAQAQMGLPSTGGGGDSAAAPVVPEDLTPEMVDDLVARMSDDQVRSLLLERLDAVAQASADPVAQKSIGDVISATWEAFYEQNLGAWVRVPALFSSQARAISNFVDNYGGLPGVLTLFGLIAVALAAGFAAEFAFNKLTQKWHERQSKVATEGLWGSLKFLFNRFCRELMGLVVWYIALRTVGLAILTPEQLTFAGPFVTYLIWFPRVGAAVGRFVLAPTRPDLRLVNINDRWAGYLFRHQIGLVLLGGFTLFIVRFNANNGVELGEARIGYWLTAGVHIYIGIIAWRAREGLTEMMRGTDPDRTEFDERIARAYPYFAIAVTAVMWVIVQIIAGYGMFELLLNAPHYQTMFWLLMAPAIDTLIRGLTRHLLPPMIGEGEIAVRAYKATKRSYIRIGRVIAGVFVVLRIAAAWDIDLRNVAAVGVGHDFAGAVIEFLMIIAIGYIINEVVSLYINRRLAKEHTAAQSADEEAGEGGGAGGSRLATVLPLVRISAQVAIAVIFGLLAIGALGVDITPLLAGAGILGLAIGFGAQKLVSDVVSGVFFLIDDAFRVGEYVEIGSTRGAVEKISIRSMQLRHHRGPVHTVPYGEIPQLTNYSRDWVIMKLKFTVPFDTDPNKVKKIFKKIGNELLEDDLYKDGFLQPFKSQGVFDFDDVGMIIRGKFMAKPGQQFTIRKEIYNRVKKEFEAAGIPFARREVRVAIPGLEDAEHLSDGEKTTVRTAVGAAAGDVASRQDTSKA